MSGPAALAGNLHVFAVATVGNGLVNNVCTKAATAEGGNLQIDQALDPFTTRSDRRMEAEMVLEKLPIWMTRESRRGRQAVASKSAKYLVLHDHQAGPASAAGVCMTGDRLAPVGL